MGLVHQGSSPWAGTCSIVLGMVTLIIGKSALWKLSDQKKEDDMVGTVRLVTASTLETIWAIATSTVAGALPA